MSTILLVDDSRDGREPLAKLLRLDGYTVDCAGDGVEALEAIEKRNPDLILLDIMMPRMDGVSLLKLLRTQDTFKNTPVIVLTAHSDPKTISELRLLGVNHCLTKSQYSFRELLSRVHEVIGRRAPAPAASPAAGSAIATDTSV